MKFSFTDEQLAFRDSLRELLTRACPPSLVRAAWSSETGRSPELWRDLAAIGVLGLCVGESQGGLGGDALDWVLLAEEAGRAALPEPLCATAFVAAPFFDGDWAAKIARGEARIAVALDEAVVPDAHLADAVLLPGRLVGEHKRRALKPVDGAQRLYALECCSAKEIATPDLRERLELSQAAELCGLALRMLEMTVEYVKVRQQFGQPVGGYQAVQHPLANAKVAIEFARPLVYRAGYSLARKANECSLHAAMAKSAAADAAMLSARASLQAHGAIGYSFEHDLHLWMKRAWALASDAGAARERVANLVLDGD